MTPEQVHMMIESEGLEYFLCSFVEMSGAPKAKLVPTTHFSEMATEGAGFAGFAAGHLGQGPHDTDIMSIPDLNSLTVLPWRENVAWLAGNLHVKGEPWPYCPRTILIRQLERAKGKGYVFNVGVEPEFMLLKEDENGQFHPWDRHDRLKKPCYDLRALHRNLDLMTTLVGYLKHLGWAPYANDHEDANCQFEINWGYADALITADRNTFFKWMVRTVAEQNGLWATFMPKPFSHLTGNGTHYHMSLADTESGKNLFLDESDEMGLSLLARWFTGGILEHASALAAVASPIVNSYKRLIRTEPHSGATWAPVYITYGPSNRTQMIRVPGPGRIENRTADGASNPYLACAATLAAGLDGIEKKIDPGTPNDENLYELSEDALRARGIGFLPTTLQEAVDCLEKDEVVQGALGDVYAPYYIEVKREEWRQYHQSVSQWETENYLQVY
jgi:glutamine synthetase